MLLNDLINQLLLFIIINIHDDYTYTLQLPTVVDVIPPTTFVCQDKQDKTTWLKELVDHLQYYFYIVDLNQASATGKVVPSAGPPPDNWSSSSPSCVCV